MKTIAQFIVILILTITGIAGQLMAEAAGMSLSLIG